MAAVLNGLKHFYKVVWGDYEDPLHKDSIFSSGYFFIMFVTTYLLIVKKIGPELMKNRQPFNIKSIIIVYNIIQIFMNIFLFYESFTVYMASPNKICVKSTKGDVMRSLRVHFMLLKMFDFVETVFFALRKSFRQISLLHVYHHVGIYYAAWNAYKYNWGETVVLIPLLNTVVHAVMFIYYLLTSVDPEWKKNLTFKKLITLIQIVQLNIFWIHIIMTIIIPNCDGALPPFVAFLLIFNNVFVVLLFIKFYINTYVNMNKKIS